MALSRDAAHASRQRSRLYAAVKSCWTPTRKEHPDVWGARSRIYGPETGVPGPRDPSLTPYAIAFGRDVGSGKSPFSVLVTAAQSAKTETFLDIIGERLDNRPVPILFVGPSNEFLTDQLEPRLRDLFLQSTSLLAKIVGGLNGKSQKKRLKRVAGVTLRLGSAGSSTALKSSPAGLALIDEYDEYKRKLRDQGDILGLIMVRGITYADFTVAVTSTPSQGLVVVVVDAASGLAFWAKADEDAVTSPIWRLWQRGTRHHWCWPCPHCGEFFVPRRDLLYYPNGATPAEAEVDSWLVCPRCDGEIREHHKAEMNRRGAYVAPGERIDRHGTVTGAPAASHRSRWVSGLCSPFVSFGKRAKAYLEALQSGESEKIQTAINAEFGECAPAISVDAQAWDEIYATKRTGLPAGVLPPETVSLVATVDVQKFALIWIIRAFGARSTSWLVDKGVLHGPTKDIEVWDRLSELLTTPIDGLPIKLAFVDSGFRPGQKAFLPVNRVYEFARKHRRFVYATKGTGPRARPITETPIEVQPEDGSAKAYGLHLLLLDAGHFKGLVLERLSLGADAPGCLHLNADVDEDYCRQLVAETPVTGPGGTLVWVPTQKANHYLDCEAMAAAAAYRLNAQTFGAKAAERRRERAAAKAAPHSAIPVIANHPAAASAQPAPTPGSRTTPRLAPPGGSGTLVRRAPAWAGWGARFNR